MKKFLVISIFLIAAGCGKFSRSLPSSAPKQKEPAMLSILSPVFSAGEEIPVKYSCKGDNINPPFSISGVPKEAKSLVLIMDDPDVPKNLKPDGMFVHWVLFNMPAVDFSIMENHVPEGAVQGSNGRGEAKYTGPCPPDRTHRYFFTVYALNDVLGLQTGASKEQVEAAMQGHVIAQAELIGTFPHS